PAAPAAYTVKIVDALAAGDLGTHLPRLSRQAAARPAAQETAAPEAVATPPSEDREKEAIALNSTHVTPTPRATITATPRPSKEHRTAAVAPTPTATPTPRGVKHRRSAPAPKPQVVVAKASPTPNLRHQLDKVRAQLLAEEARQPKNSDDETESASASAPAGGGPVAANSLSAGKGYGVGPGAGSAGIQQDADFLLYYQAVQKRIKDAWSFAGDNADLTATVTFGINPDGSLNSIKVGTSSRDPAFDDSVVRAIRRAAPFAPPPAKYRAQFASGVDAVFKLSELTS
ncbi:MAG: energy transducer TonB, partial [Candidatus Binataceae bacterium]